MKTTYLHKIETTILPPTKGTNIIPDAKDTFVGWIDSDFVNWGANEISEDTQEKTMEVYEINKTRTFEDIYDSIGDIEKLCLTQAQIIEFCKSKKDLLSKDWYTFFLFKSNNQFFVARVYFGSSRLRVRVYRLSYDRVWYAGLRHRFVAPKLNPSDTQDLTLGNSDTLENAIKMCKEAGFTITKTY